MRDADNNYPSDAECFMNCPHCASTTTKEQIKKTALGSAAAVIMDTLLRIWPAGDTLIAEAIRRISEERSVSSLLD